MRVRVVSLVAAMALLVIVVAVRISARLPVIAALTMARTAADALGRLHPHVPPAGTVPLAVVPTGVAGTSGIGATGVAGKVVRVVMGVVAVGAAGALGGNGRRGVPEAHTMPTGTARPLWSIPGRGVILVVVAGLASRASKRRDGGREHGQSRCHHAVTRAVAPDGEGMRGEPEVRDGLAAIKLRGAGVVLDAVQVKENVECDAMLPLIRSVLGDTDDRRQTSRCLVGEGALEGLGDALWVRCPCPEAE
jgi:hypothetical protein